MHMSVSYTASLLSDVSCCTMVHVTPNERVLSYFWGSGLWCKVSSN